MWRPRFPSGTQAKRCALEKGIKRGEQTKTWVKIQFWKNIKIKNKKKKSLFGIGKQIPRKIWLNILTQVRVGVSVTCKPAVLLELLYSLCLWLPILIPPLPWRKKKKDAFIQSKMSALSLLCVQSYIIKLKEYYFAVLIYTFLIYVKNKGEKSVYYNITICWIWL